MPELAYLNGRFCPLSEARISIEDRGFQFADAVYEVVVFRGPRPLSLADHLERLQHSCRAIRLPVNLAGLDLEGVMREGVRRAGFGRTMVYVQLTRGVAPRNHVYPAPAAPTVVLTFKPQPRVSREAFRTGITVMTLPDFRWSRCDIKSTALIGNVLARNEALARGFDDAVFVGPGGELHEATSANLFVARAGRVQTPALDAHLLPGVTRKLVLSCARELSIPAAEVRLDHDDLLSADEAFLCSTLIDILPVVGVDGRPLGGGRPGALTRRLAARLRECRRGRRQPVSPAARSTKSSLPKVGSSTKPVYRYMASSSPPASHR